MIFRTFPEHLRVGRSLMTGAASVAATAGQRWLPHRRVLGGVALVGRNAERWRQRRDIFWGVSNAEGRGGWVVVVHREQSGRGGSQPGC